MLLTSSLLVLVGCNQEIKMNNVLSDLQNFESEENFWNEDEANELIKSQIKGHIPEEAIVPLIFDEFGKIVTSQKYNENGIEFEEEYYTDLNTFSTITNANNLIEFVDAISSDQGSVIFLYDPYSINPIKTKDKHDIIRDALKSKKGFQPKPQSNYHKSNSNDTGNTLWVGDIAVGNRPNGWRGFYGHAGVVHKLDNNTLYNGNPEDTGTKTMEAIGWRSNDDNEIASKAFDSYWLGDDFDWMLLLYAPSVDDVTQQNIKDYVFAQDSDTYAITSKNSESTWYCSKLAWRAYKNYLGIDIDYDKGPIVYPADIALYAINNDDLSYYHFFSAN